MIIMNINLKNDYLQDNIDLYIIPYYNYNFLYENCKKIKEILN